MDELQKHSGLMNFQHDHLINAITKTQSLTEEQVLHSVCHGLGKHPGSYHIDMEPGVTLFQNTRGRVPVSVRLKLDAMEA